MDNMMPAYSLLFKPQGSTMKVYYLLTLELIYTGNSQRYQYTSSRIKRLASRTLVLNVMNMYLKRNRIKD